MMQLKRNIWGTVHGMPIRFLACLCLLASLSMVPWESGARAQAPNPDERFDSVPVSAEDNVLGRADAPVTIVEYSSFTCPHCARFHTDVLPQLKEAYIDTGKVRLVFRDFPLDRFALAASMLARCAPRERYFGFVDFLFRDQPRWTGAKDPLAALGRLAKLGGLSQAKFDACLKDEGVAKIVLQQRMTGNQQFKVRSTPTLIVNGALYGGGLTFDQLRAVVEQILSRS